MTFPCRYVRNPIGWLAGSELEKRRYDDAWVTAFGIRHAGRAAAVAQCLPKTGRGG